jgi:uncharacterized caspase-like protein
LVIGNSEYKDRSLALANPKNDAGDVADVLRALGFEVQLQLNTGKRELDAVFEKFARLAATADSALFFYAGHAIQYNGKNYLMPVDAELEDEISVRYNLVSLEDARSALDRASGVKIMILDACRNNPIADRLNRLATGGQSRSVGTTTRGLARIDKTQGMVIAFATAPDDVALDGNSRNSPFTSALIKEMQVPGLEIGQMFRRVARDVNDATGGRQRPETSISLLSDYFLNQSDRKIWEDMRDTADVAQIQEFLRRFPNSVSALDAKYRLDVLERAKREREDEQAAIQRDSYQKQLAEQVAAMQAQLAKLQESKKQAEALAAQQENQRQQVEKAQLAALEQKRKDEEQAAAERAKQQKQAEEQRLAKLEQDRQDAAKALQERQEAEQRRQAAEKLAKIEEERVKAEREATQREEARRKEQEAVQKAAETCKAEQSRFESIANDEAKLKLFSTTSVCADARVRAENKLASLQAERERQDRICDSESQQLAALMKVPSESRDKLAELQSSLACEKLRPAFLEAINRADAEIKRKLVRNSQAELRRIGCYRGPENGEFNEATKDALKHSGVAQGKSNNAPEMTDALLSQLKGLQAPVCAPPKHEPEEKPIASPQTNTKKSASRVHAPGRDTAVAAPAPRVRAESRYTAPSAGAAGAPIVTGTGN